MTHLLIPMMKKTVSQDGNISRSVCSHCGFVDYQNPKIIVGSVVRHEDKILLCRRAIEPQKGLWTIPAGYLELNESPKNGACREAREEANAELQIQKLLAVYTVDNESQVQLFYRARLAVPGYSAGEESLEVRLFSWDEVPWDEIAFPTVLWALEHDRMVEDGMAPGPFENPDIT